MKEKNQDRIIQVVVFAINEKEYGLPVIAMKEVIKIPDIVPIPNAPDFISGVINLRGNILCVIDLRKQFHFQSENTEGTRIMIVLIDKMMVGLMVDQVHEVINIIKAQIDPVPQILNYQIPNNCIVGIAKFKKRIITLLNIKKILSTEQVNQLNNRI